jgi:acyl-CoA dehydrogenase
MAMQIEQPPLAASPLAAAEAVGRDVLAPAARSVDVEARFPLEALEAYKRHRLLAAGIPAELGGLGCGIDELVRISSALAEHCASAAMVWTMHHTQIACLVDHVATVPRFARFLRQVSEDQLLLASVTTETGVGGDIRSSRTAVEEHGQRCRLVKDAPTISYGDQADAYLVTARRAGDAAPGDQVLVLLERDDVTLEQQSVWDTLGMRGTCSPGFRLTAEFGRDDIVPVPFAEIAARTMVPQSHILWSACWTGIASAALARARLRARKSADDMQLQARLADAAASLQLVRALIRDCAAEYEALRAGCDQAPDVGFAVKLNSLKLRASELTLDVVQKSLAICGIAGYAENSPLSVARHLRDVHSAQLMINNDRLYAINGKLLLLQKEV